MMYKMLYIEDLDPSTIVHELENQDLDTTPIKPTTFEDTIQEVIKPGIEAILIDFRLGDETKFDAPTIAQTLRTKSTAQHKYLPIFLISSEGNISGYYKDFTSHDLFDSACSKSELLSNIEKHANRYKSFIKAYKTIEEKNFIIKDILDINEEKFNKLDYRLCEKLKSKPFENDTYAVSNFINKEIVKSIGLLIGEDVLSARLGISKTSQDWLQLLSILDPYKYTGIFSDAFNRWWANDIEEWWKTISHSSLRRLNSEQRVDTIRNKTKLNNLEVVQKAKFANSNNFWTICKETRLAIDPIDGLELHKKELLPWQEKEYISMIAALEGSQLFKYVKPSDKKRFTDFAKNI